MRVPLIVYADFKSFTPQLSTWQSNPEKSNTKQYQKHIPSGFCYHIKCFDDTLYSQQPVTFVNKVYDDNVAQIFIGTLEKNIKESYKKFNYQKSMINRFVITPLFVTSVMKNSVKIGCVIIVICVVSLEVLLMKSATKNTRFQRFPSFISQFLWL